MPKAAIYCRLSIEDKDKLKNDDSRSIRNQKAMLRDYCYEQNWDIYDIYCDDGYSGIDRCRPEFNRLLRDCENGYVDIVLCKDQSRFSRDTVIIEQYINEKFLEWGVRFVGVADNADSNSEIYGTVRLFTSAYNEMYVRDISSKIRRTLTFKRQQGQFVGSFAPYGYMTDKSDRHHLAIDENTAPVVRIIFDMYNQGCGYRRIVQELNKKGIPNPSAYKKQTGSNYINSNADSSSSKGLWTQSTIAKILRNETYTGTLVQGKSHNLSYKNKKRKKVDKDKWIRIPDAHEAIIDSETWERTQKRLNSHTRAAGISQELSPLSGKLCCAVCGRPMKRNVYYNKSKTVKYYNMQCASYKTGAMNCTNTKSISGKVLEANIIDELNNIIRQFCLTDKINITDPHTVQITRLEQQLEKLETQKTAAAARLTNMYKDKLDGIVTDKEYCIFRDAFRSEEQDTAERVEEIKKQINDLSKQKITDETKKVFIGKNLCFTKLDRIITDELIDCIEIGEVKENHERDIHIHWKI